MCGINGLLNVAGVQFSEAAGAVEQMNQAICHRGPDDTGVWCDPERRLYLGHQRLSILDLSPAGHQPMLSEQGPAIVFNGEIYNFRELKAELNGQPFFSETDTEVLLYLYEQHGTRFLDRLNGMFALALWDPEKEELLLARDRIGIKPLYYTHQQGVFAFSSEIKALLRLPWVRAELDEEALYHFLTFSKVMPPRTMFKDIYKVRPGHSMVVSRGGITSYEPFWEVTYTNYDAWSREELEARLLCALRQSVRYRMISDVPVGAFLSGGVDSSAIVALMSEQTDQRIKTYSIGFRNAPGYDELEHARAVARRFDTDHHEKIVTPEDIRTFLPRVVDIYDEPLADATSIPIYFISQLARENGTIVVLTGDGADEAFSGYRNWMRYVRWYPYYRLLARTPVLLRQLAAKGYGVVDKSSPYYEILSRAAQGQEFFWGGAKGFKESVKSSFLSDAYSRRMEEVSSYEEMLYFRRLFEAVPKQGRQMHDVDWMCFLGLKSIVPDYYLYRADRLGMAHSIELRVPFLDHNLVDYALSLPGRLKVAGGEPKSILKKSLEQVLSNDVLYRRKQGFCVPLHEWAGEIMIDYLEANIPAFCRETGLFKEENMMQPVKAFKSGNTNYTTPLWSTYFLIAWFRKWLL